MTPEIVDIPEYVWEEADVSQNADQPLLYKELISHVKNLPPMNRIVFNMFVIEGFTHFYIADTLGISEAASKLNLFYARGMMRKIIDEREGMKSRRS
jgi:RNA polymerase sigma-70 factor (ECF subfamily)